MVALQTFHKIPWVPIIAPDRINYNRPVGNQNIFWVYYVSNPHPLPAERYLPRNQWHLICSFLQQSLLRISQQTQPFWIQRMNRPNVMQNYKLRIQRLQPKIFSDYQNLFVSASRTNEFSYLALVWCDPWRSWPLPQCADRGQFTKNSKKPTQRRPPFSIITNLKPT